VSTTLNCSSLHEYGLHFSELERYKRVFNNDAGINVTLKFLGTDMQDDYNHMMNHLDQADQLRRSY